MPMKKTISKAIQAALLCNMLLLGGDGVVDARRSPAASSYSAPEPEHKPRGTAKPAYVPPPPKPEPTMEKQSTVSGGDADQDDENDPDWYRANAKSYPCYKLAEGGLFNFEHMRNIEGDWSVTDPQGHHIGFNFCTYSEASENGCTHNTFAYMKEGSKCEELTSDEP